MKQLVRAVLAQEFSFFMAVPALVWQTLFFYIPLAVIVVLSFVQGAPQGTGVCLTLDHYHSLLAPEYFRIIGRSLGLALLVACSCLLTAYPIAYFLARKVKRAKNLLLFLLMLPFWTNFLIQLYAWFFLLERNGLVNTVLMRLGIVSVPINLSNNFFAIFIVMFYCYLPFMIMPLYTVLEKLDGALFEAAADLGADPWHTFTTITLPLSRTGICTGFFLVFVPAFSEFVIPALLGGSRYFFVGSLISHYFLIARNIFMGAAFTCLAGIVLVAIAVGVTWLFKERETS
jgi:spermidine/putrescine transport system permease protein